MTEYYEEDTVVMGEVMPVSDQEKIAEQEWFLTQIVDTIAKYVRFKKNVLDVRMSYKRLLGGQECMVHYTNICLQGGKLDPITQSILRTLGLPRREVFKSTLISLLIDWEKKTMQIITNN